LMWSWGSRGFLVASDGIRGKYASADSAAVSVDTQCGKTLPNIARSEQDCTS
jgi:hypothetical protein